jgi:hypothetical protein
MPIFARRRLQHMLGAICPKMDAATADDLVKRLENTDTRSALAAEAELALLWAISSVTDIALHPILASTKKVPEAFCEKLFSSSPAYIEVTAVSDDTFSDRQNMERAANIISQFAKQIRKGSSKHLYFQFVERSGYENGKYRRYRCITSTFQLTEPIKDTLEVWLKKSDWPNPKQIRLTDNETDVVISWKERVHPEGRTFSTMPPMAYDLENNPIRKRLKDKQSQLSGVPAGSLKCIFLVDVGCDLLRQLDRNDYTGRAVSGNNIIWAFLKKSHVDIVVVFSPQQVNSFSAFGARRNWRVTIFDQRASQSPDEYKGLQALSGVLPAPNYEGYQARSLHRQGLFHPQARGQYLAPLFISKGRTMSMTVKLSSRLLLEFLAGRITPEQFHSYSGKITPILDSMLRAGKTIQSSRLEKRGLDEDDDYLVFDLEPDAAALPLTASSTTRQASE